jgi:GNAT superfamily N-acetyltransferase
VPGGVVRSGQPLVEEHQMDSHLVRLAEDVTDLPPWLTVRYADRWDVNDVTGVLAATYATNRIGTWLDSNVPSRGASLFSWLRPVTTAAVTHGTVRLIEEGTRVVGVALWRSCDTGPSWPAATGPERERARLLDGTLLGPHPDDPHQHLLHFAVLPGWQGRGVGTTLLAGFQSEPAACQYVTAVCARSRAFFAHRGYRDVVKPVGDVGDVLLLWPMQRSPAGRLNSSRPVPAYRDPPPGPSHHTSSELSRRLISPKKP